jgi:HEAT repeat protein
MSQDVSSLITSLESSSVAARREAAESFARLGAEALSAVIPLVKACGDADEQVRDWSVAALEELPAPDASQLASLVPLVASESLDVAFWAATLLGRMEEAAEPAVPALANAVVNHPELVVRQRAAWALGKIGKPALSAIPYLETASTSEDARLARFATMALNSIRD